MVLLVGNRRLTRKPCVRYTGRLGVDGDRHLESRIYRRPVMFGHLVYEIHDGIAAVAEEFIHLELLVLVLEILLDKPVAAFGDTDQLAVVAETRTNSVIDVKHIKRWLTGGRAQAAPMVDRRIALGIHHVLSQQVQVVLRMLIARMIQLYVVHLRKTTL